MNFNEVYQLITCENKRNSRKHDIIIYIPTLEFIFTYYLSLMITCKCLTNSIYQTQLVCLFYVDRASPGRTTIVVIVGGTVVYEGSGSKTFSQNFVLTAEGKVWKVASDCFRLIA